MTHYTAMILHMIRDAMRAANERNAGVDRITIDNHQSNAWEGVHQARVRLGNDPTVYCLILAPSNAEITYRGAPIGDAFAEPLGTN